MMISDRLIRLCLKITLIVILVTLVGISTYLYRQYQETGPSPITLLIRNTQLDISLSMYDTQMEEMSMDPNKQIKQAFEKDNPDLNRLLDWAKATYPPFVKRDVIALITWKKQFEQALPIKLKIGRKTAYHYTETQVEKFKILRKNLLNALNQSSGNQNEFDHRKKAIMALVPDAIRAMKRHPNNKKLCAMMQRFGKTNSPRDIAIQIAFMRIGNRYCASYYHQRAYWPKLSGLKEQLEFFPVLTRATMESKKPLQKRILSPNPYRHLSYNAYYKKYVLPLIPKAIQQWKTQDQLLFSCINRNYSGARNPWKDAKRVAYLKLYHQHCPYHLKNLTDDFNRTPVVCLQHCTLDCDTGEQCDCIERCKDTPGILFQ